MLSRKVRFILGLASGAGYKHLLQTHWIELLKFGSKDFYELNDRTGWYTQGAD